MMQRSVEEKTSDLMVDASFIYKPTKYTPTHICIEHIHDYIP
jgi:hypothetical protein